MDSALVRAINGLRSPRLDVISRVLNTWGYYAIPAVAFAYALWRRDRKSASRARDVGLCGFAGLLVAEDILTAFVHRPRPSASPALRGVVHVLGRVPSAMSYSFPSGTATAVFAASTAAWLGFGRTAGMFATALATIVSLNRVYAGVHYPTDIVAGAIVGSLLGWLAVRLTRWIESASA
jgi:undecaprenyl-diphosphatase